VVSGDHSQSPNRGFILFRLFKGSNTSPRSSRTYADSLRRPTICDIPWKAICTSMPVFTIVISYTSYANLFILQHVYHYNVSILYIFCSYLTEYLYFQFCEIIKQYYGIFTKVCHYSFQLEFDWPLIKHTTILLLLLFVLLELFPEATVCFSVTNVRKIFSCSFFVLMAIMFYPYYFLNTILLYSDTKKILNFIFTLMPYFRIFGKYKHT